MRIKTLSYYFGMSLVLGGALCASLSLSGAAGRKAGVRAAQKGATGAETRLTSAQLDEAYARLPLSFVADAEPTVSVGKFLARGPGYSVLLDARGALLALRVGQAEGGKSAKGRGNLRVNDAESARFAVVRMDLAGANDGAHAAALDELPGKENYFSGADRAAWRTNVPAYARVKYQNIYPGVDLVYYGNQGQLEYDFVVAPGAQAGAIRLDFSGAERVRVNAQGDLVLSVAGRELVLRKPVAYQGVKTKRDVYASYELGRDGQVRLRIGDYDHREPLVIDPMLSYATFLGGSDIDSVHGIFVDGSGNAYLSGQTFSANFPVTPGVFQATCKGNPCNSTTGFSDAYVAKLNATGSALVYSTYLGGSRNDNSRRIAADSSGNAYVAGNTRSSDFPVTSGAFQTTCPGACAQVEGFITKLNATGSALLYSSYVGGTLDHTFVRGLALDGSGNAVVTGHTRASDYPTTAGALQSTFGGGICGVSPNTHICDDGFVSKINPGAHGAADLVYSTFLGGNNEDFGWSVALDATGKVYVAGFTQSTNFPVTASAFQKTYGGGTAGCDSDPQANFFCGDAFVVKMNLAGGGTADLLYGSYLGGSADDIGFGAAVDSAGGAYITGATNSTNFPVSATAFQKICGAGCSGGSAASAAFTAKFNPAVSGKNSLNYSTYIGGNSTGGSAVGIAVAVDSAKHAYVTGNTNFSDYPVKNAIQSALLGGPSCGLPPNAFICANAIITEFNTTGSALMFSSYLGGSGGGANNANSFGEQGNGILVDAVGNIYMAGATTSPDFPTTAGGKQRACGTNSSCNSALGDGFIAKIGTRTIPSVALGPASLTFPSTTVGMSSAPLSVTVHNASSAPLTVTKVQSSGDFSQTNTCGSSVAAGGTCAITVTFTPTKIGKRSGAAQITDNAGGSPQSITLTGTGQ